MSEWFNAGRISPVPSGTWNDTTEYKRLDIVTDPNMQRSYIAKKDVSAGTPLTDTEYWQMLVDAFHAVSLKTAADRLASPFSETSSAVACHPVEDYPLDVVTHIEPVQEGSGDPSPDNIRPITGHAEDVLTRCGKNLFDFTEITNKPFGSDPITLTITGSTVKLKGTPSAKYRQTIGTFDATWLAGKTLTLSGEVSGDYPYALCQFKDSEGAIKTTIALTSSGSNTGTVDETCVTANFVMCLNQSSFGEECTATYSNIQLELGTTASPYESFHAETFAVDFGQTVYGGTLDWNTGVLTVDRATMTLNGGENWVNGYVSDGVNNRFELELRNSGFGHAGETSSTVVNDVICDAFGYYKTKQIPPVSKFRVVQTNNSIWMLFNPSHNTVPLEDVSAWKVWLAANPVTVVMPLIKPITIQLTPQVILALGGVNTLYAEAGDVTVSGRISPIWMNEQLKSAIIALGGNV